jgi:hypothetical protein
MKIPGEILTLFDQESEGLTHGLVRLELFLRDGHPRFVLARERSIIPEDEQSEDKSSHIRGKKKEAPFATPVLRKGGGK